jgi:hypothetical protein
MLIRERKIKTIQLESSSEAIERLLKLFRTLSKETRQKRSKLAMTQKATFIFTYKTSTMR